MKMHAEHPASGPLSGIKVVDLTRGIPAAIATMLLADYGAEVLKLQTPQATRWRVPQHTVSGTGVRKALRSTWASQKHSA